MKSLFWTLPPRIDVKRPSTPINGYNGTKTKMINYVIPQSITEYDNFIIIVEISDPTLHCPMRSNRNFVNPQSFEYYVIVLYYVTWHFEVHFRNLWPKIDFLIPSKFEVQTVIIAKYPKIIYYIIPNYVIGDFMDRLYNVEDRKTLLCQYDTILIFLRIRLEYQN